MPVTLPQRVRACQAKIVYASVIDYGTVCAMKLRTDPKRTNKLDRHIMVRLDAAMLDAVFLEAEMYKIPVSEFVRSCIRTWLEGEQETESFRSGRAKGKKR